MFARLERIVSTGFEFPRTADSVVENFEVDTDRGINEYRFATRGIAILADRCLDRRMNCPFTMEGRTIEFRATFVSRRGKLRYIRVRTSCIMQNRTKYEM